MSFRLTRCSLIFTVLLSSTFLFHTNLRHGGLGAAPAPAEKLSQWKPADQPLLRIDGHPVGEDWSAYVPPKKSSPVLVKIGNRFLLVDGLQRKIFEVPPELIRHKGADLYWDPAAQPGKLLGTSEWVVKDVGSAYRVSAKLVADNRTIDIQISHPMDLRPIHP